MSEQQETKKPAAAGQKNRYRFGLRNQGTKSNYKSKVVGIEDDIFDVGALSDPAKYSKSLKSIENYIQKTYKKPDDIVKAIQQLKQPVLDYPKQPKKSECVDENGDPDDDAFELAKFEWKEEYKGMKVRKDQFKDNESNAWALIYDQCAPELKNKLDGTNGFAKAREDNDVVKLLIMIRSYCCQFDSLNDEYMSIVGALKTFSFFSKSRSSLTRISMKTLWR